MSHLKKKNIICPEQHGFRCGWSCERQLLGYVDEASEVLERGNQEDIIVLDFEKAFDKVSHTLLVHKLRRYGIGGRLNAWINSFLENRQQAVVVGGERSNFMPVDSGVPQGSVVGPCLFLLYINDRPIDTESKIRLFADDTLCSNIIKHKEDQKKLQQDLDSLTIWEKQWSMSFHPQKCYTLSATRKKRKLYRHTSYTDTTCKTSAQQNTLASTYRTRGRDQTKPSTWSSRLGVGHGANNPTL